MRRALALLLALTLLGAAGIVCAHRAVGASAEAVEVRETALFGDSAAAQGIRARMPLRACGHLHWDTELETAADSAPVTRFRYTAGSEYPRGESVYSGLIVNVMTNMGAGGNFGAAFDFLDEGYSYEYGYYDCYGELLHDVASRTAAGEEHVEYVELTDWIDYLPLQFDFELPGFIYVFDNGEESVATNRGFTEPLSRRLAEQFRLPLPGPVPLKVSVSRNTDGEIVGWNINGVYRDETEDGIEDGEAAAADSWEGLDVGCRSVVAGDACYFVFTEWSTEGDTGRVDFSALPGGRGLYRLPFEIVEYDNNSYHGSYGEATRVYLDDIEAVLPVAEDVYVELLDTDGERLLLFTVENKKLYLTQATLPDLADVRKTELTDMVPLDYGCDGVARTARAEGLYYLETAGGRALLLESAGGGEYGLVLDVPRDLPGEFPGAEKSADQLLRGVGLRESYYGSYGTALLWDGGRLALARWCGKDKYGFYDESGGFALWVYDETGPLYLGVYESSLSLAPTDRYDAATQAGGDFIRSGGGLELAWK